MSFDYSRATDIAFDLAAKDMRSEGEFILGLVQHAKVLETRPTAKSPGRPRIVKVTSEEVAPELVNA